MRHTHLKEPIALFSQCAARWRVEALLDFSIKVWPTVKERHSKTRNCVQDRLLPSDFWHTLSLQLARRNLTEDL